MKLVNKILEKSILIENYLALFGSELNTSSLVHLTLVIRFPYSRSLWQCARNLYVPAVHLKHYYVVFKMLIAWFLETDDVSINC